MKIKSLAVVLALVASAPAMAACTSTFELGVMGTPSGSLIGNSFGSAQKFSDCYNFSLGGASNIDGFALALDFSSFRDISLGSIALSGGSLSTSLFDPTATTFSFNDLLAGTYQLAVNGTVTGREGGLFSVGYGGALVSTASTAVAPVPEPQTYALLALGLLAMGWTVRRRNEA